MYQNRISLIGFTGKDAEAQDLTQEFFASALQRDFFRRFDPSVASFRTYLRMAVERYAAKVDDKGEPVKGGQYGALPSLTDLDDGNLKYTTDYRRMYATLIGKWMGHADTEGVLRGKFDPLPLI